MATHDDWNELWSEADQSEIQARMARRRMVAKLVEQSVGFRDEIDLVVDALLDETIDFDDSELDDIAKRARLNARHPMENRNPSKTEIKRHIAYLCNLAK